MAGLHFDITGDNSNFMRKLEETRRGIHATSQQIAKEGEGIEALFGRMAKGAAALGLGFSATQLIRDVIRVRGEFQQLEIAFETMLKSKDKASALMGQLTETAAKTPFDLQGVAQGAKQLLAYGTAAEDVNDTLVRLGNIAAGLSIPLNDLVWLYGTTQTQGRLFTRDVQQFMGRGIPLVKELAKEMGKTEVQINEMVTAGKIGFPEVEKVIRNMTGEGGQFYNLMEKQSASLTGQISNLGDAWDMMLNKIGTQTQEVASSGISAVTSLVENYEKVGKVIAGLVLTYGTYRTAVILNTATTGGWTLATTLQYRALLLAEKAQKLLNATMLKNPYVLVATAIVGAVAAMWAFHDSTTAAERAQKRFNEQKEEAIKKEQEHKRNLEDLISTLQNESTSSFERLRAMNAIKDNYPSIFQKYIDEKGHVRDLIGLWKEYNEEVSKGKIESNKESYEKAKADYEKKLDDYNNNSYLANTNSFVTPEQARISAKKQLDESYKYLQQWQKEVRSDELNQWQLSLKKNTDAQITAELKEMKRLQQARKNNKRYSLNVGIGSLKGITTDAELQKRISVLESELSSRNPKSETQNKSYWEKQKKEANAALESIASSQKKLMDAGKFDGIDAKVVESYKKNSKLLKQAEKELKVYDSSTKQEKQADKIRQEQEKYKILVNKQELERIRANEDLQMQVDEARIKSMDEGSKKTIEQMEFNFEKEMQAIDRQKEDALRKKIENSRSAWEANPANKGKSFDASGVKLSDDQRKSFDELYKATIADYEKAYSDLANQYLSYTDQRLEIEKKFNDDVVMLQEARKKAVEKGDTDEVAKLDRSIDKHTEAKNEDVFRLDAEQFKKNMNWEQVFGNLDKVSSDTLKKLKSNLKDFIATQKDLSPENLKELVDAVERIDEKLSERNPFESMSVSFKSLKAATDAQHEAQKAYNKALKEGTDEEKKNAKATLESAKDNKQKALSEATIALRNGVNEIGHYVEAGNQVIGIMETLGLDTPKWLEGAMAGFGEMLNGLGNIDLTKPMSIVTGSLQTIKGALSSITSLGGMINWNGSNAKEVQEAINKLTDRNEILGNSIDKLTDVMEKEAGSKSISAYKQASEYQKEQNANTLQIAREQARYSGSHHSWQYYMGWTNEQIQWARKNVDKNFSGTDSLWGLTPEQMKTLLSNADIYEQISGAGKGGYGNRVMEKLEAYADNAGKLEELTDKINESLMQVSFDGLRDSFLDSLMDMNKDAKSFSEDFSEYMQRALLNFSLGEVVDEDLKKWYDDLAELMKAQNGKLTEKQLEDARIAYDEMVQKAMGLRDELAAATGYDKISQESTSQSATSKGFQTMSQDTGNELNGRFTALQISNEEIKNSMLSMLVYVNLISVSVNNNSITLMEIKNLMVTSNSYLEDISGHTKKMLADFGAKLDSINKNIEKAI